MIPFRHKFVTRHFITKQPLLLHVMLKQGKMWFTLENDNRDLSQKLAQPKSPQIENLTSNKNKNLY